MNNKLPQQQLETAFSQPSEIDLFELISLLWKKKLTIIFITIVCMVLAAGYAFFIAKERWTAKAYISQPRIEQIQSYVDARRVYGRILNEDVDAGAIGKQLFSEFINFAYSPDVKMDFLEHTNYYNDKAKELKTPLAKKAFLQALVEKNLVITSPEEEKRLRYDSISMTADNPVSAKEVVEQYIQYLNKKSFTLTDYEFKDHIDALLLSLKKEKDDVEKQTKIERENMIKNLSNYYQIAKDSGIKEYYDVKTSAQILTNADRFMLGEKLLGAELEVLKNSPVIYPYRYYQINEQIGSLQKLEKVDLVNNQAYRYQLAPEAPLAKDAPKRVLIIVLGFILGIVIGVVYIFLSGSVNNYSRRVN